MRNEEVQTSSYFNLFPPSVDVDFYTHKKRVRRHHSIHPLE